MCWYSLTCHVSPTVPLAQPLGEYKVSGWSVVKLPATPWLVTSPIASDISFHDCLPFANLYNDGKRHKCSYFLASSVMRSSIWNMFTCYREFRNGRLAEGANRKSQVPELRPCSGPITALAFTGSQKIWELHVNYVEGSAVGAYGYSTDVMVKPRPC